MKILALIALLALMSSASAASWSSTVSTNANSWSIYRQSESLLFNDKKGFGASTKDCLIAPATKCSQKLQFP